jgi:hypothetical protein
MTSKARGDLLAEYRLKGGLLARLMLPAMRQSGKNAGRFSNQK